MDGSYESSTTRNLRRSIHHRLVSRQLQIFARRVVSRGRDLCLAVHEMRRRPDLFYYLAKCAETQPRMRRFVPLSGGATDHRLQIETGEHEGVYVFCLSGEVDLATVPVLQGALGRVQNSRKVVLDCHRLTYIDSSGLNLLIGLRKRGYRFVVVAAPSTLQKILRVNGLNALIPLARTREEALRVLTEQSA